VWEPMGPSHGEGIRFFLQRLEIHDQEIAPMGSNLDL
jgi:hypothetical protein